MSQEIPPNTGAPATPPPSRQQPTPFPNAGGGTRPSRGHSGVPTSQLSGSRYPTSRNSQVRTTSRRVHRGRRPAGRTSPSAVNLASATGTPAQPRRRGPLVAAVALAIVAASPGAVGGVVGYRVHVELGRQSRASSLLTSPTMSANQDTGTGRLGGAGRRDGPAVGGLRAVASSDSPSGEGSGVILSADGLILTNNHVIDGATSLEVQFNDGSTATATVVGRRRHR